MSTFEAGFDYGPNAEMAYNTRLRKNVYQFAFKVKVRFGGKGENLTFWNLVNGKPISSAVIEFDH